MVNIGIAYKKELVHIKMLLKEYPRGLTITDIAKEININRNSVARYMDVLTVSGQVEMRSLGPAKVFYLSNRVPMSAMLNFSSDYILILDNDLKIMQISDNLLTLLNIEREAILGLGIEGFPNSIFSSQEMHSRIKEAFDGKEIAFEKEIQLEEREIYFDIKMLPTTFDDGSIGLTWILQDITERKKSENALLKSEERFRSLFESAREGIIISGPEGKIMRVNSAAAAILGYDSPEELVGIPAVELYLDPEARETMFKEIMARGYVEHYELTIKKKDDSPIHILDSGLTRMDEEGNILQTEAFITDITERKKAEESLRQSEEKYRALFVNMLNGCAYCKIILDEKNKPIDFVYLEVNDAFEGLTGLKKEDVVGKRVTEAIPGLEEAHPELFEIYGRVSLTGKEEVFDIAFKPLNLWLHISVYSPRKGYFVTIFENITERKSMEKALTETNLALRDEIKELTFFYAAIREMQTAKSVEDLTPKLIDLLVQAMQFPDITAPVMKIEGKRFAHKRYREHLTHGIHAEICIDDQSIGRVSVYYTENCPFTIPHEQNMLNALAENLGGWTKRTRLVSRLT